MSCCRWTRGFREVGRTEDWSLTGNETEGSRWPVRGKTEPVEGVSAEGQGGGVSAEGQGGVLLSVYL